VSRNLPSNRYSRRLRGTIRTSANFGDSDPEDLSPNHSRSLSPASPLSPRIAIPPLPSTTASSTTLSTPSSLLSDLDFRSEPISRIPTPSTTDSPASLIHTNPVTNVQLRFPVLSPSSSPTNTTVPLPTPPAPPMATPGRLPYRDSHSAPKWDRTPTGLNRFLNDVNDVQRLFTNLGLTLAINDQIEAATSYVDAYTAELWEQLAPPPVPAAAAAAAGQQAQPAVWTWDTWTTALRRLYPRSDPEKAHTLTELEKLGDAYAERGVYTQGELGAYHRSFIRVSNFLVTRNKLHETRARTMYLRGFGRTTANRLLRRLEITHPLHDPEDPFTTDAVKAAADYVLAGTSWDSYSEPIPTEHGAPLPPQTAPPLPPSPHYPPQPPPPASPPAQSPHPVSRIYNNIPKSGITKYTQAKLELSLVGLTWLFFGSL
jgi:hypothetical protein